MPHPKDYVMQAMAVAKRFGTALPVNHFDRQFRNFNRNLFRSEFNPLSPDELDPDPRVRVVKWLETTSYSAERKAELLLLVDDIMNVPIGELSQLKSHIKKEFYVEPKIARWINARCDKAKILLGPFIKPIENVVYKSHWFIKHVPIPDRPALIEQTLCKYKYIWNNDYTSFEAHMIPKVLKACELQLYSYMLKNVHGGKYIIDVLHKLLAGKNKPRTNMLTAELMGVRMSGEMCTSLGNGITNLCVMLFAAHRRGYDISKINGFVEGDDGIFGCDEGILSNDDFQQIGFLTKFEVSTKPSNARFCQLMYNPVNFDVLPDIRRNIMKFCWTFAGPMNGGLRVMLELLRAKALSLAYEAPHCPILRSLAKVGLRLTRGVVARFEDNWKVYPDEKSILDKFGDGNIDMSTRIYVEKFQKIGVDIQLLMEDYFDNISVLGKYDIDQFHLFSSFDYKHYLKFVVEYEPNTPNYLG